MTSDRDRELKELYEGRQFTNDDGSPKTDKPLVEKWKMPEEKDFPPNVKLANKPKDFDQIVRFYNSWVEEVIIKGLEKVFDEESMRIGELNQAEDEHEKGWIEGTENIFKILRSRILGKRE